MVVLRIVWPIFLGAQLLRSGGVAEECVEFPLDEAFRGIRFPR